MIRTQVYLHKDQVEQIVLMSEKKKKAKAKVIRDLIQKGLEADKDDQTIGRDLLKFAELGKKLNFRGPKDLSTNLDKYLYEDK